MTLLDNRLLASKYKRKVQAVYAILIIAAIAITVVRTFTKPRPRTRANTLALSMGAKSLVVLTYELLTEMVPSFRRFASPKVNLILNCLEMIFWGAVAGFLFQANLQTCVGVTCKLSWTVLALAIVLSNIAIYLVLITLREYRDFRRLRSGGKTELECGAELRGQHFIGVGSHQRIVGPLEHV